MLPERQKHSQPVGVCSQLLPRFYLEKRGHCCPFLCHGRSRLLTEPSFFLLVPVTQELALVLRVSISLQLYRRAGGFNLTESVLGGLHGRFATVRHLLAPKGSFLNIISVHHLFYSPQSVREPEAVAGIIGQGPDLLRKDTWRKGHRSRKGGHAGWDGWVKHRRDPRGPVQRTPIPRAANIQSPGRAAHLPVVRRPDARLILQLLVSKGAAPAAPVRTVIIIRIRRHRGCSGALPGR